jgi:3-deoxy-D-manno-octulosonate 8-phosphate phosphatase (KDO 8-P phosphatase)
VLDVDGVLTDGRLYFSARGEALKVFHVRDGHGIKLLMGSGVAVAAVSGRRSAPWRRACANSACGMSFRLRDKVAALQSAGAALGIDPLACACIVDDTPDLPLMSAVGFAAAVADAHPVVLSAAHWVAAAAPAAAARCANCATRCCAPAPGAADAVQGFTLIAVIALGVSTWILSSPAHRPQLPSRRQKARIAGLLLEERRAHRL